LDREKILQRFEQEPERMLARIILDRVAQMEKTGQMQCTDFLDPFQQRVAEKVLFNFRDIKYITWGGYPEAERTRLLIFPSLLQARPEEVPLSFAEADTGPTAELTHRDYLGAALGLGLRREKLGDIIITERGTAQFIISPDIAPYLFANLLQVGNYPARIREITASDLQPAVSRSREIRATVASLRLDAVASAGFGVSRSKLVPAIRTGHLKLNWQSVHSASAAVKEGDIISLAGRGRVELASVLGQSKKGRIQVLLKKRL
jgi:RNA-binding protein YlmH